jgi:hypothetical protein
MQSKCDADQPPRGRSDWPTEAVKQFARDNGISFFVAQAILKNAGYSRVAALAAIRKMRG